MPGSMPEGKMFIKNFFLGKDIKTILDVGPGSGNYVDLFRGQGEYTSTVRVDNGDIDWTAVEIFAPYVDRFNLHSKYDIILVTDIYDLNWSLSPNYDIIILGDVLEHMIEARAREVIKEAVNHSTWVVISLPIIYFPQDASYGNIHETHVEHYSHKRIMDIITPYGVIDYYLGATIGAYIVRGKVWK